MNGLVVCVACELLRIGAVQVVRWIVRSVDDWWIGTVLAGDNRIGRWLADGWIIDRPELLVLDWS